METKQPDNSFVLDLAELVPQEAHFKLSTTGDLVHTLKPYSLRVQLWAAKTFGSAEIERAINARDAGVLSAIAWEVLKDRTPFRDFDHFLESVESYTDRSNLLTAVFETLGMSLPTLQKIAKKMEAAQTGNAQSPSEPTGANSSTQSEAPTRPIRKSKRS